MAKKKAQKPVRKKYQSSGPRPKNEAKPTLFILKGLLFSKIRDYGGGSELEAPNTCRTKVVKL